MSEPARDPTGWRRSLANGAVVTVVALLLWFWAAGRTRETTTVVLSVRFAAGGNERMLALPIDPISVEAELQGSRRELERAGDRLTGKTLVLNAGQLGIPGTIGTHSVDLAVALGRAEEIEIAGVAIVAATPAATTFELVETEVVDATIAAVIPGVQLTGPALAEPRVAAVTLPKSLVGALGADPRVEAYLPAAQANQLEAGRRHALDLALRLPEALESQAKLVRIAPERARISFTLLSRSATTTLNLVPVQIAGPPTDLDGYTITIEPTEAFLRDVEVTGPSETISALEDGRAKAFAFIHLSADDLALRVTRKRVGLWLLPPGVTVNRIGESIDTMPPVRLTIGERRTTRQ